MASATWTTKGAKILTLASKYLHIDPLVDLLLLQRGGVHTDKKDINQQKATKIKRDKKHEGGHDCVRV